MSQKQWHGLARSGADGFKQPLSQQRWPAHVCQHTPATAAHLNSELQALWLLASCRNLRVDSASSPGDAHSTCGSNCTTCVALHVRVSAGARAAGYCFGCARSRTYCFASKQARHRYLQQRVGAEPERGPQDAQHGRHCTRTPQQHLRLLQQHHIACSRRKLTGMPSRCSCCRRAPAPQQHTPAAGCQRRRPC